MNEMVANYITISRIIIAIILLNYNAINVSFLILYTIGGITDMIDGYVARKMNSSSELGSRLDSISDLFFGMVILEILYYFKSFLYGLVYYSRCIKNNNYCY